MIFSKRLGVLGYGFGLPEDLARLVGNPDFRKATPKMQLANLAMGMAIESLAQSKADQAFSIRDDVGFIFNSGYGELEATIDFLKSLSETGVARPLLFQNSLHNSTMGFCAIRFGLTGAAITLNHRVFGGEHALQIAQSLIQDKECRIAIVTTVETVPDQIRLLGGFGVEGATTLIVADSDWCRRLGFSPFACVSAVECRETPVSAENMGAYAFKSLYEFDAVRRIALEIRDGAVQPKESIIEKPYGGSAMILTA